MLSMTELTEELSQAKQEVSICVASKYANAQQLRALYTDGARCFGENRVQDALPKIAELSELSDIDWHFIGRLQRNKVRKVLEHFDCIQSVDRLALAESIDSVAEEKGKIVPIFVQVNVAADPQKAGFHPDELPDALEKIQGFRNLSLRGIMTMVPMEPDSEKLLEYFRLGRSIFDQYQRKYPSIQQLSMGMSQDYPLAVEAGATMVRIGRRLFQ